MSAEDDPFLLLPLCLDSTELVADSTRVAACFKDGFFYFRGHRLFRGDFPLPEGYKAVVSFPSGNRVTSGCFSVCKEDACDSVPNVRELADVFESLL